MTDTVVNIRFDIDSNLSTFSKEIDRAREKAAALEKQLATSPTGRTQLAGIRKEFLQNIAVGQQFHHQTVDQISATREFGNRLEKQKLNFRESALAMRNYNKESGILNKVARENMRMMQSFSMTTGPGVDGRNKVDVFTPQEEHIQTLAQKSAYAEQRLRALNGTIGNLSTSMVNWGKNTQWAGRQMMVGMTMPIAMFGTAAAVTFKKVDEELVRITKVYGDSLNGTVDKQAVRENALRNGKIIAQEYGIAMEETLALTADMAAVGYTGAELDAAVKQTTRLTVLGEVDKQKAMKATLTIKSAFGQNSKELEESINFINAAENATSTSLDDMTEALPRAGTVVKGLGGNIQDLTLYITAMREGGINAAEGANALKSGLASIITPSKEASAYVKEMGVDLEGAIKDGGGDLTATLMIVKRQLDSLSDFEKSQVMSKLFGKHQMGRMLALFNNLGAKGSQTQKILDLMKESSADLARTADQEITQVTESTSGKFKRVWQTLRAEMASIGEPFLKGATALLEVIGNVIQKFNDLSGFWKGASVFVLTLAGIVGPLVMVAGILGNFLGYMAKGAKVFPQMLNFARNGRTLGPATMYDAQTIAAEKLGTTIENGMFDAKRATDSVAFAVEGLRTKMLQLMDQDMYASGLRSNKGLSWSAIQGAGSSGAPRSMAFGLETQGYNQWLKDNDPRKPMSEMLLSSDTKQNKAMIQKMAMDQTMFDMQQQGKLTPDAINKLKTRTDIKGTDAKGKSFTISTKSNAEFLKSIKGIDFDSVTGALNKHMETILPGVTSQYKANLDAIGKEINAVKADVKLSPSQRAEAVKKIVEQRGIIPSAFVNTSLEGTGTGGRASGYAAHLGLAGTDAMVPDRYNDQLSAKSVEEAIAKGIAMEQGHTAPDSLSREVIRAASLVNDEASTRLKEIFTASEDNLRQREAAYQKIAADADAYANTTDQVQKDDIKKRVDAAIAGDQILSSEISRVEDADKFKETTKKLQDNHERVGEQIQNANQLKADLTDAELKSQQVSADMAAQGATTDAQTAATKRTGLQGLKAAITKERMARAAGMVASAGMMFTGLLGEAGNKMAPMLMGASAGMMIPGPYGAAGGAALGGGIQLFQSLKGQSDAAAGSLKLSGEAAKIFGYTLKSLADVNTEEFIKSMTENADAAKEATSAMNAYAEAIRNAPAGSQEGDTLARLNDLQGGNSIWEKILGANGWGFGSNKTIAGMLGLIKSPQDQDPEQTASAVLTQQYADAIIAQGDKKNPNQALAQVAAFAKESGLIFTLQSIIDDLKAIDTNSASITSLSQKVSMLGQNGDSLKKKFIDVFNPQVVAQFTYRDIPALQSAIYAAGMSWDDYKKELQGGNSEQKAFGNAIDELVIKLGVTAPSAVAILLAKLDDLPVAEMDFAGKTNAEVMNLINGLQKQAGALDGAKSAINKYFAKKGGKGTSANPAEAAQADTAAAQEASQARIKAAQDASAEEIKAMQDAAEKRQKAMQDEIKATQDKYDDEIKAIEDVDSEKQKAYDKEQQRIERGKTQRSSEIDYLRAMSEGRFYDASKIKNDMNAQQDSWAAEDANAAGSDKRQGKIDALTDERDTKIEKMQTAYDKQVEIDSKALEAKQKHDQDMLQQLQDSEAKRLKAIEDTNSAASASSETTAKETKKHMRQVIKDIVSSAKQGTGALKETLDKYGIKMSGAMALLTKTAGMSATQAAKVMGSNLKSADWDSLARGIEAQLDGEAKGSETYFNKFWKSLENQPTSVSGGVGIAGSGVTSSSSGIKSIWDDLPGYDPINPVSRAYGGYIAGAGTATSDSIPARLSNGEYVVKAASVKKVGVARLNRLNETGDVANFAAGGLAGSVVKTATWDYIQSRIDARIKMLKKSQDLLKDSDMTSADFLKYQKDIGTMAKVVSTMTNNNGTTYGPNGGPHSVGWRGTPHWGVNDIGTAGMTVRAYAKGKVLHAGPFSNGSYSPGSTIDLLHSNGGKTRYAHLQGYRVETGDLVSAGEKLGTSGSDHLHFEWTGMPSLTQRERGGKVPWLKKGGLLKVVKDGLDGKVLKLPEGVVSGFTNTQLGEVVDIYSKLGATAANNVASTVDVPAGVDTSSAVAGMKSKSPAAAMAFAKAFMMSKYNWGAVEFAALEKLWNKESGWSWSADNPTSDAYGIPQSLPGDKMASAGADWKTNPETQIKWGLNYIKSRYGNPTKAWGHSVDTGWYHNGGMVVPQLRKGAFVKYDNTLANLHRGESVLTAPLTKKLKDNVAQNTSSVYNIDVKIDGSSLSETQLENAVYGAIDRHTAAVGRSRR